MNKTQQAIVEAAKAYKDSWVRPMLSVEEARRTLFNAIEADRANTDPEPEVLTPEAKALIEAVGAYAIKWDTDFSRSEAHPAFLAVLDAHDAYLASLKPRLEVPWPDAVISHFADTDLLWVVKLETPRMLLSSTHLGIAREDCDGVEYLWSSESAAKRGLCRARFAEMRRQYPDASDADIDAAIDAFGKDGAK